MRAERTVTYMSTATQKAPSRSAAPSRRKGAASKSSPVAETFEPEDRVRDLNEDVPQADPSEAATAAADPPAADELVEEVFEFSPKAEDAPQAEEITKKEDPTIGAAAQVTPEAVARVANPLKLHRLSEFFPAMDEGQYNNLKASIRSVRRVIEPIIMLNGQVLDGRHRMRAVNDLRTDEGIDVAYTARDFDPAIDGFSTPIEFVHAKNVARRHLNSSQLAMLGAGYMLEIQEARKDKKRKGEVPPKGDARDLAAAMMGDVVSPKSIDLAKKIRVEQPELVERIMSGEMTVHNAVKRLTEEAQEAEHRQSQRAPKPQHPVFGVRRILCHMFALKFESSNPSLVGDEGPAEVSFDAYVDERPQPDGHIEYQILVQARDNKNVQAQGRKDTLNEALIAAYDMACEIAGVEIWKPEGASEG